MLPQCLKCKKNTKSKNPKVVKAKNGRIMVISNCAVCVLLMIKYAWIIPFKYKKSLQLLMFSKRY